MNFDWAHLIVGLIGSLCGAAGGIFVGGWRLGRIEGKLKLHFQQEMSKCEQRIEEKLQRAVEPFGETLRGIRQKINDVELDSERRYLAKDEFGEFRQEYRDDMKRIFDKLDHLPRSRQ